MTRSTCARCGGAILPGDRYCGSCGALVASEIPPAASAFSAASLGTAGMSIHLEPERSAWPSVAARLQQATLGEFEILAELGRGGMAAVYLARDLSLNRPVAIKVMAPGLLLNAAMVERFRQEAITVANLQHAHIISIHAVRQVDDLHFFVMQFVPGRTIEVVMREHGALPIPVTLAWLYQVGSALGYAHRRGVIHRDVKPGNILLNIDGEAVVTDFGIAKVAENPSLTQTGAVVGTPLYMSPEQCFAKELTGASDQYSLAVVAYEMLAGHPPFSGSSFMLMRAHTDEPPPPLREARPDVPAHVEAALMRMLAKRPDQRFPTLGEALSGLGAAPLSPADPLHETLQQLAAANERLDSLRDVLRTPASPIPKTRERPGARIGTPSTPHPATEPITIEITPLPADLEPGAAATLHADVRVGSGPPVDQPAVVWESGDPTVASIDRVTGLLTALEPGRVTVTAMLGTVRDSKEVVIGQPTVATIDVAPKSAQLEIGRTVALIADVSSRFGAALDRQVEWSVEHANIAAIARDTLAPVPNAVIVRGLAPGNTGIIASCEGVLAVAKLHVVAAPERAAAKPPAPPPRGPALPSLRPEPAPVQAAPVTPQNLAPADAAAPAPPRVPPPAAAKVERTPAPTIAQQPVAPLPKPVAPLPKPAASPPAGSSAATPPPRDLAPNATVVMSTLVADDRAKPQPFVAPPSERKAVGAVPAGAPATPDRSASPPTTPAVAPPVAGTKRRPWIWVAPVVLLLGVGGYVLARGGLTSSTGAASTPTTDPSPAAMPATDSARAQTPADLSPSKPATPNVVAPPPAVVSPRDSAPRPTTGAGNTPPTAPVARRIQLKASRADAILPGQTMEIAATVRDEAGKPIRNAPLRWSSSDPGIAAVDATGKVVGVAEGTARISAQSGAASEVVTVTVNAPPPDPAVVVSVELSEIPAMTAGDTVRLNAVARNALGSAATGASVSWTSSDPAVATVSPNGVLVARGAGSSTITAASGARSADRRATVRAREVPRPKVDTPAAPPPKSEAELRAEIQAVVGRYTGGIEGRDTAQMHAVFPSAPADVLKNWQLTFADARDGIQLRGPDIEILDAPRDAAGSQVRVRAQKVLRFYSKQAHKEIDSPLSFTAVVQRTANGWRIVSMR